MQFKCIFKIYFGDIGYTEAMLVDKGAFAT